MQPAVCAPGFQIHSLRPQCSDAQEKVPILLLGHKDAAASVVTIPSSLLDKLHTNILPLHSLLALNYHSTSSPPTSLRAHAIHSSNRLKTPVLSMLLCLDKVHTFTSNSNLGCQKGHFIRKHLNFFQILSHRKGIVNQAAIGEQF